MQEATRVSETQRCSPPVQITQLLQGKPSEMMKFGLSQATRPQSSRYLWGSWAAAQGSWDKTTATSLSAANHLPAKHGVQSPLTRLGLTLRPGAGQGLFPTPQMPEKDASLRGMRGFSIAENTQHSGDWGGTCL